MGLYANGLQAQPLCSPGQGLDNTFRLVIRRVNAFVTCWDSVMTVVFHETTPPVVSALGDGNKELLKGDVIQMR